MSMAEGQLQPSSKKKDSSEGDTHCKEVPDSSTTSDASDVEKKESDTFERTTSAEKVNAADTDSTHETSNSTSSANISVAGTEVPTADEQGVTTDRNEISASTEDGQDVSENASSANSSMQAVEGFSTRYLNDKWIGRYDETGQYMEYSNNQWRSLPDDDLEFIQQLWLEQEAAETQIVNGVRMKWNATTQEWQRADQQVDEDFIATYQANYGVPYDYSKMDEERKAKEAERLKNKPVDKEEKKKGKPAEPQGWVDMEEKVHAVYVNNLPLDITLDEFKEFMSKCGVIQPDARTNKPKLKLYMDENGELKGDGRCVYIKKESVDLALSILDGFNLRGKEVHVEKARFQLKGEFDPTKKRKKLTNAQKKKYMENQKRIFEWKPEKPRNYRPISDCTVVIKNLFTLQMMEKNAALMLDLKEEVQESCSKYGTVKKVVVYDNNPEGVVTVTFETTDESDMAVKMLNSRVVDGRRLEVSLWDGKTRYKIRETEEERQRRLANWQNYIKGDSDDEDEEKRETAKEEGRRREDSEKVARMDDKDVEDEQLAKMENKEEIEEEEVDKEDLSPPKASRRGVENSIRVGSKVEEGGENVGKADDEEKEFTKTENSEQKEKEEIKMGNAASLEASEKAAENLDEGPTPEKRPRLDGEADE